MDVVRCLSCDALSHLSTDRKRGVFAYCPCCHTKLSKPPSLSLSGELALVIAAIALFIPAQIFNLVEINLLGAPIATTVSSGALTILKDFPIVALLILFCTFIAPVSFLLAVLLAHFALFKQSASMLTMATSYIAKIRDWVMIDVFLISLAVASFKVNDFTKVHISQGLVCFILLHLLLVFILSRISIRNYWNKLTPDQDKQSKETLAKQTSCSRCQLLQDKTQSSCIRCDAPLRVRQKQSIQKTWAYVITASIFVLPANLYSISILFKNGKRIEDTIISGVTSLITDGLYGIAAIIFTASILVPIAKILGLIYILCSIHFHSNRRFRFRTKVYHFVHFIGKWSMMDLFVIGIMISLIDRGNLLDFIPGLASNAFGLVVIFTMLAVESLDPRLIWDAADQDKLAKYHRQKVDGLLDEE